MPRKSDHHKAELYRRVIDELEEFIVHWKKDGVRTFVNKAYCDYYGTTEAQSLGTSFFPLISTEDYNIVKSRIDSLTPQNPESRGEHRVVRPDGSQGWNFWKDRAVFEKGELVEYRSIGRDITEQKQAEEKLAQAEKMEAIGQLAGGVAHDFNNQLSGIQAFCELLKARVKGNSELESYADNILTAVKRSSDLTHQLLAFSRKGKYQTTLVNIHDLMDELEIILERSLDKRICLTLEKRADNPTLQGYPSQLQNALLNLALNARDAMPEGGTLTLKTQNQVLSGENPGHPGVELPPGNYVTVSITDSGIGIDPETAKRIFEPFFTTKGPGKGTGMGLAGVYGTLQNHGGAICVDSIPGKGTSFHIYLPASLQRAPKLKKDKIFKNIPGKACILFVDDEEMLRTSVSLILGIQGYAVHCCADGEEAVSYFRDHHSEIDLVLIDMMMPGLTGKDALAQMKEIDPSVQAILLSGFSLQDDAAQAQSLGVEYVIEKPFSQEFLVDQITKALERVSPEL